MASLVVVILAVVLSAATETGTRAMIATAVWLGHGNVRIGNTSGTLWQEVNLDHVVVLQPNFNYHAEQIQIQLDVLRWQVNLAQIPRVYVKNPSLKLLPRVSDDAPRRVIRTLPFDLKIERIGIEGGVLETAHGQKFALSDGHMSATLSGTQLAMNDIKLHSPQWQVEGHWNIHLQPDFPVHLDFRWKVLQPDQTWGFGTLAIKGARPHYEWTLLSQAPVVADMHGALDWPLGAKTASIDTQLRWVDLRWPLWGDALYRSPRGELKVKGTLDNYRLHAQGDWLNLDETLSLTLDTRGKLALNQALDFENAVDFSVHSSRGWRLDITGSARGNQTQQHVHAKFDQPFGLAVAATVSHQPNVAPTIEANAQWQGFRLPLDKEKVAQLTSDQGNLTMRGTVHSYQVTLHGKLGGVHVPSGDWQAKGQGDLQHIRVTEALGQSLGGVIKATGDLRWAEPAGWTTDLVAEQLNPGEKWPYLASRLSFDGHIDGLFLPHPTLPLGTLTVKNLKGDWMGLPLVGEGGVSWFMGGVDVLDSAVAVDGYKITGKGRITHQMDVQLSAPMQHWRNDLLEAQGDMRWDARLSGVSRAPKITLEGDANNAQWRDQRVGQSRWNAILDAAQQQLDVQGALQAVDLQKHTFASGRVGVQGSLSQHQTTLELNNTTTTPRIGVQLQGGIQQGEWRGQVNRVEWDFPGVGAWHNSAPGALLYSASKAMLERFCMTKKNAESRLCTEAKYSREKGWNVAASLANYAVATTFESKGRKVKVDAPLEASGSFSHNKNTYAAQWKVSIPEGSIQFVDNFAQTFRYHHASIQGELRPGQLKLNAQSQIGEQGSAAFQASIENWRELSALREGALDASMNVRLTQLNWLQLALPHFDKIAGELAANVRVGGSLAQPHLRGHASLRNASASIPEIGIALSDVSLAAKADDPRHVSVTGSARSGKGLLNLNGLWTLPGEEAWSFRFGIQGNDFEVMDLGDTVANVSPDLNFSINRNLITVDGVLAVPYASIVTQELPANAVRTSPDAVMVGTESKDKAVLKPAKSRWPVNARVLFKLSDRVYFSNANLSGRMTGQVTVIEEEDRNTHAAGQLQIKDGKYDAYGQKLEITRGLLQFIGPLDDPGLDVEAVRKLPDVTAGVRVAGTLKKPVLKPFANPPQPDRDVISYILFGRPIKQANSGERNALAEVFVGFGLSQSSPLAQQIAERIGIEGLTVTTETGDTGDSSVVFGGYFSPRLYVSYGVGIFGPAGSTDRAGNAASNSSSSSRVNLRYKLSDKWSVEAGGGTETGGVDFIYAIER
jgi:translocation and assembly module TamB